ncbi:DUF6455 family protein [Antarcticimicrobium luteum]|uniref:DUF6455 domain-containing protein n=1 Tax=Antarcticimicrobium luteum TaxID=2547397 RepID=A0A4R5UQD7_9RHOB|nr:DUF6455 family protein [Antarcticimicrobium luteum]TDK41242.1 hypothetical protein E1832_21370 [Antarcticimicrobium luteum]
MQDRETLKHHAALLDRMAGALGIDLEEAALSGRLTVDEISDAVLRCTGCAGPAHCTSWLAMRVGARAAPGYCRNRDLMARLRAAAPEAGRL